MKTSFQQIQFKNLSLQFWIRGFVPARCTEGQDSGKTLPEAPILEPWDSVHILRPISSLSPSDRGQNTALPAIYWCCHVLIKRGRGQSADNLLDKELSFATQRLYSSFQVSGVAFHLRLVKSLDWHSMYALESRGMAWFTNLLAHFITELTWRILFAYRKKAFEVADPVQHDVTVKASGGNCSCGCCFRSCPFVERVLNLASKRFDEWLHKLNQE